MKTTLTARETEYLTQEAVGKRVVEVGCLFGHSTLAMAKGAELVVAIDPHRGYPTPDSPSTLDAFMRNVGDRPNIVPVVARAEVAISALSRGYFDMAFVDISDAKTLAWLVALIRKFVPLLCVHDATGPVPHKWPGAAAAVAKLERSRTVVKRGYVDSMAVLDVIDFNI